MIFLQILKRLNERKKRKQKRKRYASGRDRRGQIPNRRPLSERPAHIEGRKQVGHWECDTIIDANHKQAIVTVVERKSGYAVMAKVTNKTSALVSSAIVDKLKPLAARVKTLTFDNGKEFTGHETIATALNADCYFADPYSSWQRGLNENTNGLLRQYFPKGTDLSRHSKEDLEAVALALNRRPRKALGWRTPAEALDEHLLSSAEQVLP